jgi:hypothetical protein
MSLEAKLKEGLTCQTYNKKNASPCLPKFSQNAPYSSMPCTYALNASFKPLGTRDPKMGF